MVYYVLFRLQVYFTHSIISLYCALVPGWLSAIKSPEERKQDASTAKQSRAARNRRPEKKKTAASAEGHASIRSATTGVRASIRSTTSRVRAAPSAGHPPHVNQPNHVKDRIWVVKILGILFPQKRRVVKRRVVRRAVKLRIVLVKVCIVLCVCKGGLLACGTREKPWTQCKGPAPVTTTHVVCIICCLLLKQNTNKTNQNKEK